MFTRRCQDSPLFTKKVRIHHCPLAKVRIYLWSVREVNQIQNHHCPVGKMRIYHLIGAKVRIHKGKVRIYHCPYKS